MGLDHKYFNDEDDNNEVDALRAQLRAMNESNLWMFAQRAILQATESQQVMLDKFPELWKKFNGNVTGEK